MPDSLLNDLERFIAKTQIDHAGMFASPVIDELTKVAVGGDKDSLFQVRRGEDVWVRKIARIIDPDRSYVMAEILKKKEEATMSAGIQQESHATAE
jgi:hypothetical protein